MSGMIIDASVVVAWLFKDEKEPFAERILEQLVEDEALVPQIWHLETRNALLTAERRGRLSPEEVKERLDALMDLPIATDGEPDLQSAFDLARTHQLSLYDAVYLELATRKASKLATLDERLGQAAADEGVSLSTA